MCNIISGSQYSKKGKLSQCCCGCSLRAGTLTIGWFLLISSIFWIIDGARGGAGGAGGGGGGGGGGGHSVSYGGIGSLIITILSAIFILIGVYKSKIRLVWVSVYLMIVGTIWDLIMTILFFLVGEVWIVGVVVAALALLNLYFVLVVRSYAYEAEVAMPSGNPA